MNAMHRHDELDEEFNEAVATQIFQTHSFISEVIPRLHRYGWDWVQEAERKSLIGGPETKCTACWNAKPQNSCICLI